MLCHVNFELYLLVTMKTMFESDCLWFLSKPQMKCAELISHEMLITMM